MDLIDAILHGDLLRKHYHGTFKRAVRSSAWFQSDQAQYGRRVDDPAAVTRGVKGLR